MILQLITGYLCTSLNIALTIFTSNVITGVHRTGVVEVAAVRAVVGLFWPYLALLTLRWILFGGHFYELAFALSSGGTCVLRLASPVDLFSYEEWKFTAQ